MARTLRKEFQSDLEVWRQARKCPDEGCILSLTAQRDMSVLLQSISLGWQLGMLACSSVPLWSRR